MERERERRRWPGTKNKGCPPLSLAVARGAIRPAFQLTGRRCSRVRPRRKLALFTRRLRDAAMRGERKLATINSENQFERRWFFGGQKATGGAINGDNGCRLAVSRRQREREREGPFRFLPFSLFPSLPSRRSLSPETKEFPSDAVLYRPAKIYDRHRESRILRNNSIVARRPRLPPLLLPSRRSKITSLPPLPVINVVFENVFENSSNFIATVNRTIRSYLRYNNLRFLGSPRKGDVLARSLDRGSATDHLSTGYFRDYRLLPSFAASPSGFRPVTSTPPSLQFPYTHISQKITFCRL